MTRDAETSVLTDELLQRIRSRAAGYDRDNAFFAEDLDELREAGYLRPRSLLATIRDQRRLGAHAPATALAINMHLVWTGVARILAARGDRSLDWVLAEAEAGELFAFAISEPGNDLVLWDSATRAEPVVGSVTSAGEGGWAFTGTKVFTSLAPAWTRLGVFGRAEEAPGGDWPDGGTGPRLVHGFLTRDTPGWRHLDDWDTLGMRATQSRTTVLEGAVVPPERVSRILPVGPNPDPFVFAVFASFLLSIGSVYAGIADRALELGVEAVQRRTSRRTGLALSQDPDLRWRLADAALALDALRPDLETLAADVDGLVDHGAQWFRRLTGAKHRATETARVVVDHALRVAGGSGYAAGGELARLQRDVLAGIYHPSDPESVRQTVAANLLGPLEP
ncbi:acyl-CoA dehydrogenase family protein [Schumannella luteola]|uniref:Alkylation response protein AidB-like acyl-CoA dehydrogenase n=1 Tax=Schumannella luteola TaxID=472059 RepID=A0A852Y957_9MICO|nr:acyl-CoA dehydrogenase family protein [Schumannella luteola]NYG97834.1 alkylation response protein AidB-like acyl-CoA dehydrogenase [Schumannella luteola]TPX02906.1 acyl-CoA dehydrogenase [Schumannella luteola]